VTFDEQTRRSGERSDAPATVDPQTVVAGPTWETRSPIEKAMSAARRVVGAVGPAEANNGDDIAEDGMTTSSGEMDSSTSPADEEEADKHAASNDWGVTDSVAPSVPTVSRLQSARSARERPMARVTMAVP